MSLDNQDIVFASLLGAKAVDSIGRFNTLQNELAKRVLPPIPFLPLKNSTTLPELKVEALESTSWQADLPVDSTQQYFPLSFSFSDKGYQWVFPYEPLLTIAGGNNIVETNVAKQGDKYKGTIKERWSQKDFDVTITGVLMGTMLQGTPAECYPKAQLQQLFDFLKQSKVIYVNNYALEALGINMLVVYDYSFPFTKGENVQAYEIKCKSDFPFDLLLKQRK